MNAADSTSQRGTKLPDLDTLDMQSLKALVLTQQAELDSRTTEIEKHPSPSTKPTAHCSAPGLSC